MRRRSTVLAVGCLLLLLIVAGALMLSSRRLGSQCQLALVIIGATNGSAGTKLVTLRLLNTGQRAAEVLPAFGIEAQPPKVDATMLGTFPGGVRTLHPGQALTSTIPLPPLDDRSWRVFFRYWERRSPLREFGHYWLMQAGLVSRETEGSIAYTDWVISVSGSQPAAAPNAAPPRR